MQVAHQSGIYEILNTVNGKRYIGSALNMRSRWGDHRKHLRRGSHDNSRLQRAWNKYGAPAFDFGALLVCAPINLIMYEQKCLDSFTPEYNICKIAGSTLGTKRPPEFGAAVAARMRGTAVSLETRAAMSITRTGKKHSLVTRAKMVAAATGRVLSAAARSKIASSRTGARISSAHQAAIAEGRKAYWDNVRAGRISRTRRPKDRS